MRHLLAKSRRNLPPEASLLVRHTRDVVDACRALHDYAAEIALRTAGISNEISMARFSRTLRACGWIQDLGKANSHFFDMVDSNPTRTQLLRHETVSILLFEIVPDLREILVPLGDDGRVALWAAAGHHRKFDEATKARTDCTAMTVFTSHPDFTVLIEHMANDLNLSGPKAISPDLTLVAPPARSTEIDAFEALDHLMYAEKTRAATVLAKPGFRRYLALVKAFGIAADVAASAIPRRETNYDVGSFVKSELAKGQLTSHDLRGLVEHWASSRSVDIEPLLKPLAPNGVRARSRGEFQRAVAGSLASLTLVQAGCGSGKSLAAYLWAREWALRLESEGRQQFRLFFSLPTTGTTTEHFKDYALESDVPAHLAHSRAPVDLQGMAETADQEEATEDRNSANARREEKAFDALRIQQQKIEALALWSAPLTVSTTDTILGLMSNSLKSLCSIPAIMTSAIVFDEIHAFDAVLFGHLLRFLEHFPNLPILLMTASLQPSRLEALHRVRPDLQVIPGPSDFECLPRYNVVMASATNETTESVKACVGSRGKVLWVRNRVAEANETFARCRSEFPDVFVQVYHSRFRYMDRSKRHRQVIDRFGRADEPAILVATQVAEMSLDLSADLLVSDLAPVTALIQRLGRLNRRWEPGTGGAPKQAIVIPVLSWDAKPYEVVDLDRAEAWVGELIGLQRPVSQADLTSLSERHTRHEASSAERAVFFDGGWETYIGQTRGEGYTISVILEADYDEWRRANPDRGPRRDWLRDHEVSIPGRAEIVRWPRVGHIPIASEADVTYDWNELTKEGTGAKWRKSGSTS